ncbi:transient receptor potential cation channel subfamily M member-like 2 isoform X2 [Branchiostoma floridae]|uniref:Transient receptor potential cation channel subfamily M member-like 2 isoform X2 n=1 Tax=Branchiostoma floridae TaxID=7739 RepID=A0A9J7MFI6_BRAFL|nr:transient receptor potential cation channel subfamily M member-like 2 isoform X2 [Branchiostoma floridae]
MMSSRKRLKTEEDTPLTVTSDDADGPSAKLRTFVSQHRDRGVVDGSFGELKFRSYGQASPYVRVTKDIDPEVLWELMTSCWDMKPPNLIISVVGGDAKFVLKERLKKVNKGLANAALSTGAWIITAGLHRGVSKYVGEAIWGGANCLSDSGHPAVNLVGITTWGNVHNRHRLQGQKGIGRFSVRYRLQKETAPLDLNHTHFILVDDGTVETEGWSDVEVRTRLEQYIGQQAIGQGAKGRTIPVVLLLIEGGSTTLKSTKKALRRGIPVVILDGSGGAADVIALAARKKIKNELLKLEDVEEKLRSALDLKWEGAHAPPYVISLMRYLNSILKEENRNLVTVVRLNESDAMDIDEGLLRALLKAEIASPEDQLDLALDWKTSGSAWQDEIFTRNRIRKLQSVNKDPYMVMALLQDNAEVVEMLLDNGMYLPTFLTKQRLTELYIKALYDMANDGSATTLNRLIEEEKDSRQPEQHRELLDLSDVDAVICGRLLESQMKTMLRMTEGDFRNDSEDDNDNDDEDDDDEDGVAERNLFFWSVLTTRKATARLLWRRGTDQIATALTASKMLKELSSLSKTEGQLDEHKHHSNLAEQLETDATGVLDECYRLDPRRTLGLLTRPQPRWGEGSCMAIANSGKHMAFMSHAACQTNLNRVWFGNMEWFTPLWKVILSLVFFPITVFTINFTDDVRRTVRTFGCTPAHAHRSGIRRYLRAIYHYQTAPITKFYYTVVFYVVFLMLFSLFLLTDLRPEVISPSEGFLAAVMGVQLLDEIRQIVSQDAHSCLRKLQVWQSDVWNRMDAAILVTFFLSFIMHCALRDSGMAAVKVVYSCALILAFYRPLQMFYVHEKIGPKIIMIREMLQDLLIFLSFLVVFVLAFGVVRQALLTPNSLLSWKLFVDVVRIPYWLIYAQLLTDPEGHVAGPWLVSILQAVYVLVTNVLLINLLIAMFKVYRAQRNSSGSITGTLSCMSTSGGRGGLPR